MTTFARRPGYLLKNGTILIEQRGSFVLAILPHNRFTPYATWRIDDDGETHGGDYFRSLDEALTGLGRRAAYEDVPERSPMTGLPDREVSPSEMFSRSWHPSLADREVEPA